MKNDKKADAGSIKFILLNGIGNAVIDTTVTDEEVIDAINYIIHYKRFHDQSQYREHTCFNIKYPEAGYSQNDICIQ